MSLSARLGLKVEEDRLLRAEKGKQPKCLLEAIAEARAASQRVRSAMASTPTDGVTAESEVRPEELSLGDPRVAEAAELVAQMVQLSYDQVGKAIPLPSSLVPPIV
jgi:hypothetical protein